MNVSAADRHRSRQPVLESYLEVGFNYRMTDIQAAVGLVQLGRSTRWSPGAGSSPPRYRAMLADVPGLRAVRRPGLRASPTSSRSGSSSTAATRSAGTSCSPPSPTQGVSARRGIMAAHRQPAYAGHPHGDLAVTERLTDNTLILPLFHTMTEQEQQVVVDVIRARRRAAGRLMPARTLAPRPAAGQEAAS